MFVTICVAFIAAGMVVLLCFQIAVLLQIRRTASTLERFLETARSQVVPLSHDLTVISQDLGEILRSVHRQVDKVEESITSIRDAAVRLGGFGGKLLRRDEGPVLELMTLVIAVSQGLDSLLRIIRR
jgi:uncharacterized protein YoxC